MIGAPHPLHTHSRSSSYIYSVSAASTVDSGHEDATPTWCMIGLTVSVVVVGDSICFLLVMCCRLWFWTPHPLHTHVRSTSYIYIVFQHLLLWLVVIRMQPNLISALGRGVGELRGGECVGILCWYWWRHPTPPTSTHIRIYSIPQVLLWVVVWHIWLTCLQGGFNRERFFHRACNKKTSSEYSTLWN